MNLPGFSADASLRTAAGGYRQHVRSFNTGVAPSIRIPIDYKTCGGCTELKWPDGSGTGSCAEACCDNRGNCTSKPCPCPTP
jgi:hypothetical protein